MRALLAPVGGTLTLHLLLALAVGRAPAPRREKPTIPLVVRDAPRPRAELPPPPAPPPRQLVRSARRSVRPVAAAPEPPPAPPQGFSVDTRHTVAESSVAVAAKEGGGNAFADPGNGLPPGDKVAVRPPPPPEPARFVPAEWITDARDRSPPYPSAALRNEIQGQVLLRVCVGPDGGIDSVQVVRGIGFGCDEAAARWAKERWHFKPARRGDAPVPTCLLQPMRFELER